MVSLQVSNLERQRRRASMEPCLFRHGKFSNGSVAPRMTSASMEPCLFRHGKTPLNTRRATLTDRFNGAMSFQTW
ncbi:protein of unknown function [Methanoculleus bourgensis]|uniref:Uncharacterized protein n=1 Tax=Methanoculleus bourgensis TaxID=83986 RepID=A0A110BK18_9EURY|nr:protein of unknown function [Methanoculleus bourgensis]